MKVSSGHQVQYALTLGDQVQPMNALIGKVIHLAFWAASTARRADEQQTKAFLRGTATPAFKVLQNAIFAS